jgi:L-alanine-DL-glutamate epimerase-like enolase superfamily enzyme
VMLIAWTEPYAYTLRSQTTADAAAPASLRKGWHLLVRDEDGHVGCGDVAPWPGVTTADVSAVLETLVQGPWRQGPLTNVADVRRLIESIAVPEVRYGLELALLNLLAQRQGGVLEHLLGADPTLGVPLRAVVTGAEDAAQKAAAGAAAYKVKLTPGGDLGPRLAAIREVVGHSPLSLDANRRFPLELWNTLRAFEPELVEEPGDTVQALVLAREAGVPVALDESLYGLSQSEITALLEQVRPRAVILKPDWVGGLLAARDLAERFGTLGIRIVCSYAWTSEVGRRGAMALWRSLSTPNEPAGLWSPFVAEGGGGAGEARP